jgi:hypothetical protein
MSALHGETRWIDTDKDDVEVFGEKIVERRTQIGWLRCHGPASRAGTVALGELAFATVPGVPFEELCAGAAPAASPAAPGCARSIAIYVTTSQAL